MVKKVLTNENRSSSISASRAMSSFERFSLLRSKSRSKSTTVICAPKKKKEKSSNDLFCSVEDDPYYFFKVCGQGNVEKLIQLVKEDPLLVFQRHTNGHTGLHHAAGKEKLNAMDILMSKGADINAKSNDGNTPLHVAIEKNRLASVRHLLTLNADTTILNADGLAPIHLAVMLNKPHILEEMLSHKYVDIELVGRHGLRACHYACMLNDPQCLAVLFRHRCLVCQTCENGHYPLHIAVKCGSIQTMRFMLDNLQQLLDDCTVDRALNFSDKECNTPLHIAVNGGDIEMVQVCLEYGSRVDSVQENKSTPFHFACAQGSLPIVRLLYESYLALIEKNQEGTRDKKLLDARDCLDMTPLHRASIYDHFAVVEYLIAQKASLNGKDRQLRTPLLLAVTRGGSKSANLLLDAGADIEVDDIQKRNILHYLVLNASTGSDLVPLIERIVQDHKGRNLINSKDSTGCTPLHLASRAGNVRFTETLLRLGAVVRLKDNDEQSPLHFAARYGRYNTVKRLLDTPAGPNIINETDSCEATALHIASANGHPKIVQLLMCKGALIHKDNLHRSPLHLAVENGHPDIIQILLTFHSNLLDSKCKIGGSPLHFAANSNQPGCVEFLLSAQCEYVVNNELKTPLDLAIEKQNVEAAMAMIQHTRWEEILTTYDPSGASPVYRLIQNMPEVYKVALDRSITQSNNESSNKPDWIKFNFKFVQSDICKDSSTPKSNGQPLRTLNAMVEFGRIELLSHPLCLNYLNFKWLSYGFWFYFVTMFFYTIFVLCLTASVLCWHNAILLSRFDNFTKISGLRGVHKIYEIQMPFNHCSWLIFLYIFFYSLFNLLKEFAYIIHQPVAYFTDMVHYMKLTMYTTSMVFTAPVFIDFSGIILNWKYGSVAVFLAWCNLVIYFQRLDGVGLYVIMFRQILFTIFKVFLLFSGLFIAFGLAFYLLLWNERQAYFKTPIISIVQTVTCMMGDWNYVELFADPYFHGTLIYPTISFAFLIIFVALMPILFINLLIGLAVGDIEMVQKDASLKRLAMQVDYHTELEKIMPVKMLKKWKRTEFVKYNFKNCATTGCPSILSAFRAFFGRSRISKSSSAESQAKLESHKRGEFEKTKKNLEIVQKKLDHLNELMRLIVQKMEIGVEADYNFDNYAVLSRS